MKVLESKEVEECLDGVIIKELLFDEPVREAFMNRDFKTAANHVSDEILEKCTVSGNHTQCVEKLQAHIEAGVTLPIICPIYGKTHEVFIYIYIC